MSYKKKKKRSSTAGEPKLGLGAIFFFLEHFIPQSKLS